MALNIQNRIIDQLINSTSRYFYLYEPLPILVSESDLNATVLKIDLVVKDVDTNAVIETLEEYAVYDINSGQPLNIDIIKIIQQRHNADIWKVPNIQSLINSTNLIVSEYAYDLDFYTDINEVKTSLSIVPIIGGRVFEDFNPLVSNSFPINDFEKFGIDVSSKWINYPTINTSLNIPNSNSQKVNLSQNIILIDGKEPCGGMLYWKSRLGGWMNWGFEIKISSNKPKFTGRIETGMFNVPRNEVNQSPYVETDYSGVEYTNNVTLKSLSLSKGELNAVNSINESPICYYLPSPNGRLELMKLSSANVPLSNLSNGGDFQVSLKSISKTDFKTR